MTISDMNADQVTQAVDGYRAAAAGLALDPAQSEAWRDGWQLFQQLNGRPINSR